MPALPGLNYSPRKADVQIWARQHREPKVPARHRCQTRPSQPLRIAHPRGSPLSSFYRWEGKSASSPTEEDALAGSLTAFPSPRAGRPTIDGLNVTSVRKSTRSCAPRCRREPSRGGLQQTLLEIRPTPPLLLSSPARAHVPDL